MTHVTAGEMRISWGRNLGYTRTVLIKFDLTLITMEMSVSPMAGSELSTMFPVLMVASRVVCHKRDLHLPDGKVTETPWRLTVHGALWRKQC